MSRFSFVLLDTVTLIDAALDRRRYAGLATSAAVAAVRRGARMLLETLDAHFPSANSDVDRAVETWRFRQSYLEAAQTLKNGGCAVRTDSVEAYVAARAEWDSLVLRVAPILGYAMSEIDQRQPMKRPDAQD